MDDFDFSVLGEHFHVSKDARRGDCVSYHLSWLNGPAAGTYGFTIGRVTVGGSTRDENQQPPMSREQLINEARKFIEGFYAPGGIGEEDFPTHVAARLTQPLLRPWQPADAAALVEAYRSSADLATQLGSPDLASDAQARDFIFAQLGHGETHRNWAIVEGSVAVGNVGISTIDRRHDTAWLYYWLADSARGRGLATRALAAVAAWAFDGGLFRLELGHRVNNPESCRVATRAGFAVEGIERQKLRYGSKRFDVELHARLRTDAEPHVDALPLTI